MKKTTWLVIISLVIALVLFISGVVLGGVDELVSVFHQGELNISLPFIKTRDIEKEKKIKELEKEIQRLNNLKLMKIHKILKKVRLMLK